MPIEELFHKTRKSKTIQETSQERQEHKLKTMQEMLQEKKEDNKETAKKEFVSVNKGKANALGLEYFNDPEDLNNFDPYNLVLHYEKDIPEETRKQHDERIENRQNELRLEIEAPKGYNEQLTAAEADKQEWEEMLQMADSEKEKGEAQEGLQCAQQECDRIHKRIVINQMKISDMDTRKGRTKSTYQIKIPVTEFAEGAWVIKGKSEYASKDQRQKKAELIFMRLPEKAKRTIQFVAATRALMEVYYKDNPDQFQYLGRQQVLDTYNMAAEGNQAVREHYEKIIKDHDKWAEQNKHEAHYQEAMSKYLKEPYEDKSSSSENHDKKKGKKS